MIRGSDRVRLHEYEEAAELEEVFREFFGASQAASS